MLQSKNIRLTVYVTINSFLILNSFGSFVENLGIYDWSTGFNITKSANEPNGNFNICMPPTLIHGTINPMKNQYKAENLIRVTCDKGFELENEYSSLLYCTNSGSWEVFTLGHDRFLTFPRCVEQKCPPLPLLKYGFIHVKKEEENGISSGLVTTKAIYQCSYGLVLEPPDNRVRYCIEGNWTGQHAKCVPLYCQSPPSITRGYFITHGMNNQNQIYPFGSKVEYRCNTGYQLNGHAVVTCSSEKEWEPQPIPTCIPRGRNNSNEVKSLCSPLRMNASSHEIRIIQGSLTARGALPDTSLEINCAIGFNNPALEPPCSSVILTCLDGIWSGHLPICVPVDGCPYPPMIPNGQYQIIPRPRLESLSMRVPVHSVVYYSCQEGYVLQGSSLISCPAAGCWQPYEVPRCIPIHSFNGILLNDSDDTHDTNMAWLVSLTTASVVIFILSLIWIASLMRVRCRRNRTTTIGHTIHRTSHSPRRRGFWFWPSRYSFSRDHSSTQLDHVINDPPSLSQTDTDRVSLIAYMNNNQANLPTYDEAVGTVWLPAPPPYEFLQSEVSTNNQQNPSEIHVVINRTDTIETQATQLEIASGNVVNSSPVSSSNEIPVPSSVL